MESATFPDPLAQQMEDIMAKDQATADQIAAQPAQLVYSWLDWRREHPRVGIARTGEDGDTDAWRNLWAVYGRDCFDVMYPRILKNLQENKKIWYSMAAEWLAKNTKDAP